MAPKYYCLFISETAHYYGQLLQIITLHRSGYSCFDTISDIYFLQPSATFVNDMGGYCPTVDRPEQLLDTIQEAITNVGMTAGEDVYFGINCAAHEIFDLVRIV